MDDTRWLLLAFGAFGLQVGFSKSLLSLNSGLPFLTVSALLVLFGALPFFWPRAAVLTLFTAALVVDFAGRHNPFSILFIWVCLYHAFHLLRSQKEIKEAPQEGSAGEA